MDDGKSKRQLITNAKLARRLVEIDAALELMTGHGLAETVLSGVMNDIERGDYGVVTAGLVLDEGEKWAEKRLAALVAKWKEEDMQAEARQHRGLFMRLRVVPGMRGEIKVTETRKSIIINASKAKARELTTRASKAGFDNPMAYVLQLVRSDIQQIQASSSKQ
jgi:hypothetical protein